MNWAVLISTCGGLGFSPRAPGTVGSLFGLLLFIPLRTLPLIPYLGLLVALFFLGVWTSNLSEPYFKCKDASQIVIDELVAILLVLYFLPTTWLWWLAGFGAFRFFDIVKPPPIRRFETLPGGWGVMADDIIAAFYAIAILKGAALFLNAGANALV